MYRDKYLEELKLLNAHRNRMELRQARERNFDFFCAVACLVIAGIMVMYLGFEYVSPIFAARAI